MPIDIYMKGADKEREPVLAWLREHPLSSPDEFLEDGPGPHLGSRLKMRTQPVSTFRDCFGGSARSFESNADS